MSGANRIDTSAVSRQEAYIVSNMLVGTKSALKKLTDRVANCLARANAIRLGVTADVDGQTAWIGQEAEEVRKELEALGWQFVGHELPLAESGQRTISVAAALFGSEERFDRVVAHVVVADRLDDEWLVQLKDVIVTGYRNVDLIFSQLFYAARGGLLVPVDDDATGVRMEEALPSAAELAQNPIGPHPISGPFASGPIERKSFEAQIPPLINQSSRPADKGILPEDYKTPPRRSPAVVQAPSNSFDAVSGKTEASSKTSAVIKTDLSLRRRKRFE